MTTLSSPSSKRGVALISVLAIVVLITGLVVAFLVRAGSEKIATSHYDATSNSRVLTDTVVNMVQATISEATTVQAEDGKNTTWASQPGAIRVYGQDGIQQRIYRLYSAPSLATDTDKGVAFAEDIPPADWETSPAQWVDLNAPTLISSMGDPFLIFPILDPRNPADPGPVTAPKVTTVMPGFSINGAPGNPATLAAQPAPMPVRWLYVLQDGKIVAPGTGSGAGVAVIPGASSSNPITGRIAFWTDDETSKVNINTAAGSTAVWNGENIPGTWDTPRFRTWIERMLFSENQPIKGEYQRYPGHPATTDLSGIFKALGITLTGFPYTVPTYGAIPQPAPTTDVSGLYSILPRYTDNNTSRAGSRNTTIASTVPVINGGFPKRERLYTSVGELLYDKTMDSDGNRVKNPALEPSKINRQEIESGKFFLTAQSRAPELTLFGTPRIAMWPIHKDKSVNTRTAIDNLIAFCATVGGHPYYFQRNDSRSPTSDYFNIPRNQELFSYLRDLTSRDIPGFGGKFSSKYSFSTSTSNEKDQILTEMIDYIRCTNLHDNSVADSSTTFTRFSSNPSAITDYSFQGQATPLKITNGSNTTRGLGRIQTLSEIGVQIICTAEGSSVSHAQISGTPASAGYKAPDAVGSENVSPVIGSSEDPAYASNLPLAQYLRRGDGFIVGWDSATSTVTVGTLTTVPATGGPFPANPTLTTTGEYGGPLQALNPGEKKLQAMLLLELACPMMGYDIFQLNDSSRRPAFKVNVSGIQGIKLAGTTPFPSRTTTDADKNGALEANVNGNGFIDWMSTRTSAQGLGGVMGFRYLIGDRADRFNAWSGVNKYTSGKLPYRYVSNPFKVSATEISLSGGCKIELHVPEAGTGSQIYQTFNVDFPEVTNVPVPDLLKNGLSGNNSSGTPYPVNVPADWWGFDMRIARSSSAKSNGDSASPIHGPASVLRADMAVTGTWSWASTRNVTIPTFDTQQNATFTGSDVVRTLVVRDGDYRLAAAQSEITADGSTNSPFVKGPGYDLNTKKLGNLFRDHGSSHLTAGSDNSGKLVAGSTYSWRWNPKVPGTMATDKQETWDWDSGLPLDLDGAYSNKPDEGNIYVVTAPGSETSPYYNREQQGSMDKIVSYFTANRIVSSPVMFGSLPTGVVQNISWRTLLFRPQNNRPAWANLSGPKDHLLLDLFWMPVVEPYAISEPFSTAGKVNMNYQIVPFTYINRSTALQAVLSSELVARVPKGAAVSTNSSGDTYYKGKPGSGTSALNPPVARLPLNLNENTGTLRQFLDKFNSVDRPIFRSPSEICDLYLVPQGYTLAEFQGTGPKGWYGDDFALVGDNVRERPYSNIYPRLTTKSNTYTVHYRVQVLKNPMGTGSTQWVEGKGTIQGEYRGSTTLERYLNPSNSSIGDYATDFTAPSLDRYYQWRIVSNTSFSP